MSFRLASPEFEWVPVVRPTDHPLADDLAGALDSLGSASRRDLLDAILDTQEPTILAELARTLRPICAVTSSDDCGS